MKMVTMEIRWYVVLFMFTAQTIITEGFRLGRQNSRFPELEAFLQGQLEPFRSKMVHGIPEDDLPPLEPFYIKNLKFDLDKFGVRLDVNVHNIKIIGMSGFTDSEIIATGNRVTAIFKVPDVKVTGLYGIKGALSWLPSVGISGDGPMFGRVGLVTNKVSLDYHMGPDGVQVTNVNTDMDFDDVSLRLDNLLEGSFFQSAVASYINSNAKKYLLGLKQEPEWLMGQIMGKVFTSQLKDFFESEELTRHKRQLFPCGQNNVNGMLDNVIENARPFIKSTADPLQLPNIDKAPYITFHDGKLNGLSTLYRSGNSVLGCDDKNLNAEAELSLERIGATYDWTATVPLFEYKFTGKVNVLVNNATADTSVSQKKESGAHPVIEKLNLEIKGVGVNFAGFGSASFKLSQYVSIITNLFKDQIVDLIQPTIKSALQDQLNLITIPF